MSDISIERNIVIGLIVSTEYIQLIRETIEPELFESIPAKHLASWCIEYYDKYGEAPYRNIEGILRDKEKERKIKPDLAEEMREDILPDLNDDYLEEGINIPYLEKRTKKYLRERRIKIHTEDVSIQLNKGKVDEAERMLLTYSPVVKDRSNELDLRSAELDQRLKQAFSKTYEPVITYPGALGDMWNEHLVRGGFVGLMAGEKVGKSLILLDMGIRGMRQGASVAFFQAGDMTEEQQLMRIAIYLTKRSNKEKYTGKMWQPVADCIHNQLDECSWSERESDVGIFNSIREDHSDYYKWYSLDNLVDAYKNVPDYAPCRNCSLWRYNKWGRAFIKPVNVKYPLEYQQALETTKSFLKKNKGRFKMATYANGTLSVPMIKGKLEMWERQDNFTPDIILIDYADLLVSNKYEEFRNKQNDIWLSLRGLSQEKHALVIAPTQADAKAYDKGLLSLSNFSEDKRKYSHVTAMFGLNRDPKGIEKEIGLMRVNELVVREGEFNSTRQVVVLQNLKRGRPFLGSFW